MTKRLTPFLLSTISVLYTIFLQGQTMELRIDSMGTMDGHIGYYQSSLNDGSLHETHFLFEENGYVRIYADKTSSQVAFWKLPDSTYWGKISSLNIGDRWTSWVGSATTEIITDTETVTVPAGTFLTYVGKHYLKSIPDSVTGIFYFANNVGGVKMMVRGMVIGISSYSISGGSGYYPLAVGNWWLYGSITSVKDRTESLKPFDFSLYQNYPNPFNPVTIIEYNLPTSAYVYLQVYDILGKNVLRLVDKFQQAGKKSVEFNASKLPSGVYFYRLQAGSFVETKKLVLLK